MKKITESEETRNAYMTTLCEKTSDLLTITDNDSCEKYIENLEKAITDTLDIHAPLKKYNRRDFLPDEINVLIDLRNRAKIRAWSKRNHENPEVTRQARCEYNKLKKATKDALTNLTEQSLLKALSDPSDSRAQMWKIQRNMKAPNLKLPNIDGCSNEKETIDALVDAAIVNEAQINPIDEGSEKTTPFEPLDRTSTREIHIELRKFKNKKAPGPDQIRADAMKLGGEVFIEAFKPIADYVLETGYFPRRWKIGECIFLHKTGKNHKEATSYRPITLLNIMGKLCERLILSRIQGTVDKLQPPFQHGFTRFRGTATQILRTGKIITDALALGESVSMICTDLSKAFDSINHKGLIKKLQNADAPSNVIKIIENYLEDRCIIGKLRTMNGELKKLPHGVPQGSILGPVIFNLYVHDIWDSHDRIRGMKLSQYADDLCILNRAIKPDHATLRAEWAAETIVNYYDRWGLKCNVDKTECILFTKKKKYKPTVKIKKQTLTYKKEIKYLGVIFDKTLKMNPHTDKVVKKLKQVRGALGPIIGFYAKTDVVVKLAIIQACILPIMDYGVVQLLSRYSYSNLLKIERQYRMALKSAGQFSRRLPTETLWEIADLEAWHLRAADLNRKMLDKVATLGIEDLDTPGDAYLAHGEFNPLLTNNRIGEITYIPNKDMRRWPRGAAAPRPLRIK
jgi:hypothetical protein